MCVIITRAPRQRCKVCPKVSNMSGRAPVERRAWRLESGTLHTKLSPYTHTLLYVSCALRAHRGAPNVRSRGSIERGLTAACAAAAALHASA